MLAFAEAVTRDLDTDHVHLLFNNAGIGSLGGSFVDGDRAEWEKTFNVCWYGVYYCTRAFLPLLRRADAAHIVNTSSVNGFRASINTAYSTAKFAVKAGVKAERWRILVGKEAAYVGERVRAAPAEAYSPGFYESVRKKAQAGEFNTE